MAQVNSYREVFKTLLFPAILNSYSVVFFLNNKWMASLLLLTSLLNFHAGMSGLLAVLLTVTLAYSMNFDKLLLKSGVLSFNALLTGIGLGTYFEPGLVFYVILLFTSVMSLILSVTLGGKLFKLGLPFLSIPFVITFWLILLPANFYENLGLIPRTFNYLNVISSSTTNPVFQLFHQIETLDLTHLPEIYFRSLSSIIFQNSILAGIVLSLALLISSRIYFSLSVVGFLTAYLFAEISGTATASFTYYNIGANYMMVAFAVGGFFLIPSKSSYFWTVLLVPITAVFLLFLTLLLNKIELPVFSMPFALITILFVHFIKQKTAPGSTILTPVQQYSPENNLYAYQNNIDRLSIFNFVPLQLPYWGKWSVSQAYDGEYTHKGEWGNALDFMILDEEGRSWHSHGYVCEHYYCYNKPILAPADGIIVDLHDHIDDNPIGEINTRENWGNTIVIKHGEHIYTQLSHLKKGSFKIKNGDQVKQGDILANCGNSGRSPYPHLHFQVQTSPYIGSKTISYPFAYYIKEGQNDRELDQFSIPKLNEKVSGIHQQKILHQAFNFLPETSMKFVYFNEFGVEITENLNTHTDAYNYKYIISRETGAVAYYTCDHLMFYFTTFYGNRNSILYYLFLSAYKVMLSDLAIQIEDKLPHHLVKARGLLNIVNDFVAPFYPVMQGKYISYITETDNHFTVHGDVSMRTGKRNKHIAKSKILIGQQGIDMIEIEQNNKIIRAKCIK